MNCENVNKSIHCSVTSCTHHCGKEDYCSLSSIMVGTHEKDPTKKQCTDCQSFSLKSGCC